MLRICALLAFLGAAREVCALDPHKALTQYSTSVWTQQQGLPQDTIRAITQTTDGYLWLGTDEGLARFDGYDFTIFNRDRGDLPSNSITVLAAGADGSLWIGQNSGLTRYRDRRFRTYTRKDGLPDDSISALFVDQSGILWIVAGGNLARFDGAAFTNFLRSRDIPLKSVRALTQDKAGNLLLAGNNAVVRMDGGKFILLTDPSSLAGDFPSALQVDHNGNLWILGVRGLIERLPDGRLRRYGSREGLSDSYGLNAIREDRGGTLWVGTDRGIARLEGSRFHTSSETAGAEHTAVRCLFEDREGNFWVGSNNGLARFRDDVFVVYGKNEGWPSDEPSAIHQDRNGRIWVGFPNGLTLLTEGKPQVPAMLQGLSTGLVFNFQDSPSGELLVSSRDGLIRIKGNRATSLRAPDSSTGKAVVDALEMADGSLWLATPSGLGVFRQAKFETIVPGGPRLGDNSFNTLAAGTDGSVWAGTQNNGLWHYKAGQARLYTTTDGLGSNQIRSLSPDQDGTLWIGTKDGGLHAEKDGRFLRYTARDGLPSDNIWKVANDGESLWLCSSRGISRVSKRDLREFSAGQIKLLQTVNYGLADGLRSEQCIDGERHADGSLWFVTRRGVAVYDPNRRGATALPPQVYIKDAAMDGKGFAWASAARVPAGEGRLTVRYAAVHLRSPERVQYSYRLIDVDPDWVRADGTRAVNYDGLRHGRYRFTLRAELPEGLASETSFDFELLPHFYETWWFRVVCAMALLAMICVIHTLHERQVHSAFAIVLEERVRLAREIHDTLTQGFVGIASQLDAVATSMPDDGSPARQGLDLARRMARHSLTEARRSVMDLRAVELENRDLGVALESGAHQWVAHSGIGIEVDVNGEAGALPEQVAHQVYRVAQEAVTNAMKHAHATQIALRLRIAPQQLNLQVVDDGCGFEPGGVFTSRNGNFGLLGMQERARQIGGKLRLDSQPGSGTRVEITVPLK
jgi:ligand-binding sensor domain-containing protein/two-component sensor histidine kinase